MDTSITLKTAGKSITAGAVGSRMKEMYDTCTHRFDSVITLVEALEVGVIDSGTFVTLTRLIDSLSFYVPEARTITINGVAFDLSQNRSWTITESQSFDDVLTIDPIATQSAFISNSAGTSKGFVIQDGPSRKASVMYGTSIGGELYIDNAPGSSATTVKGESVVIQDTTDAKSGLYIDSLVLTDVKLTSGNPGVIAVTSDIPPAPDGSETIVTAGTGATVSGTGTSGNPYVIGCGCESGGGTVTSVALSMPAGVFDIAGSPVTNNGTLAVTFDNQSANAVFAGPTTGSAAAPGFRTLVSDDIPTLAQSKITNLTTDLSAKEVTANKATDFGVLNNTLYPTTQAVDDHINSFGFLLDLSGFDTDDLAEGATNLYWTNTRFDTKLGTKTTDNLVEGSTNLYWTTSRFDTRFATKSIQGLSDVGTATPGANQLLKYNSGTSKWEPWTPDHTVNSISTARLWGRTTAGTGVIEEIAVSNNMELSGGTLDVRNGVADGATKGVLALDANDFNTASGVASIDWANTQKASGSQPGALSSADWSTFNGKQPAISSISGVSDGDIFYWNGGVLARLGIGSTNEVLKVNGSGLPEWDTPGGGSGTDDWTNFTNVPQNIQDLEAITFGANDMVQYVGGVLVNQTPAQVKTSLNIVWGDIGAKPTSLSGYGITDGQPLDADLTAIAGLSPSNDDIIQRKAGAWTNRTMSQLKTDLNITWSDIGSKPTTISGFGITDGVTLTGTETLGNKTLTTPTIGSFANANHDHTNSTGGGQLTDAALSSAVSVPKGGTGVTSLTAYGVVIGGTSSTAAVQSVAVGTAGQVLTSNGAGAAPTMQTPDATQAELDLKADKIPTVNAQTGTTYTLQASDNNNIVTISNASAITLTVPSGLAAGFNCLIIQKGAGKITFSASGTTIVNRQSFTTTAGTGAFATIASDVSDNFYLGGDLE